MTGVKHFFFNDRSPFSFIYSHNNQQRRFHIITCIGVKSYIYINQKFWYESISIIPTCHSNLFTYLLKSLLSSCNGQYTYSSISITIYSTICFVGVSNLLSTALAISIPLWGPPATWSSNLSSISLRNILSSRITERPSRFAAIITTSTGEFTKVNQSWKYCIKWHDDF